MSEYRSSRGASFLTAWQWLTVAAAVGTGWFIWLEVWKPQMDAGVTRGGGPEEDPRAAALDNLRTFEAIARDGPDGVPELVDALASPDFRLRRNALLALRLMGPEAIEALAAIREHFVDDDARVRSYAIDAYWSIRRDPDDVAAVTAPMLGDPDAHVREVAAKIVESIGPSVIGLIVELLSSGAPAARVPALKVLWRMGWDGTHPEIDDAVREFVGVAGPDVRIAALIMLATWGRPTPDEIRDLLRQNDGADSMKSDFPAAPGAREAGLRAIIRQGPAAVENLNDVLDLLAENRLGENQWSQWSLALAALRGMQSAARPAAPRLLQFMNELHDYRRIDVDWSYLAIGGDPHEIVALVVPLLLDKDTDLCFHAGRLCASVSPDEARRQVSRLIPLLAPEKLAEGLSALDAVWGLAPEAQEAIPALSRLLECNQPHVARIAAKTLGGVGPLAAPALPALQAQLARGPGAHDYWARGAFCEAIGKMGPAARSAISALLVELNDAPLSRAPVRDLNRVSQRPVGEVLSALVRIGDSHPAVLAAIRRHAANGDEFSQIAALRALARLNPDAPEVLTSHLKCLGDGRGSQNRVEMILAIGRLGGNRQAAVAPLTALLADYAPEIRKAAAWSLGKIGPTASVALPSLKEVLNDWKNTLYSADNRRYPATMAETPRSRLNTGRWFDPDDPLAGKTRDLQFQEKSVKQVVREAIAEIEAVSNKSGPRH